MIRIYTGGDVERDGYTTVYASDCDVTDRPARKNATTHSDRRAGQGREGRHGMTRRLKTALRDLALIIAAIALFAWSASLIHDELTSEPGILTE